MNKKFLLLLSIICFTLVFFSCSDSLPNISELRKSIIYDFENEDSSPKQYMVLFVSLYSDERRIQYFDLIEKERELRWYIANPEEVKIENKKYFGSSEIMIPDTMKFIDSNYELRYFDLADRMVTRSFNLITPYSLKNISLEELRLSGFKNKEYGQEFTIHEIVLYDILNNPLYVGAFTQAYSSKEAIQKNYPQTFSYCEFFRNPDYSAIIMCPQVFINDDLLLEKNEG